MEVRRTLALIPILVAGCTGTCRKTTPYVPFLEDAASVAARDGDVAQSDAALDSGSKNAFQKITASLAPTGANKWSLDGLPFDAPPGSAIVAALAHDVDGDGQKDIVAYTQPPGGGGGELRFHRGDGKGGLLTGRAVTSTTSGAEIAMPAPCLAKPQATMLTLVGPHSVALDLRPTCGEAAPAQRRFAFAAFAPTPSIRWAARAIEPPAGWTFGLDVDAIDQDGDGVDDPTFNLALEGGGPPWEPGDRLVAKLPYWDRPAGLSRNRAFPESSFQLVAQRASGAAAKKGEAARALPIVRRLRILHGAICAEGGAPWLEIGSERGVPCGASKALEDAGFVEVRASLASNDAITAIATRERLSTAAVARTTKTRTEIDKAIDAAVPSLFGSARELKTPPSTPSKGAPAWGALAFESSGKLLIRAATGVVRVDTASFDEKEADDVPSWPWEVALPGKDARLSAVIDPCDAPNLAARVAGHDVPTGATLLPLPMLPSMSPSRCGSGSTTLNAIPVAWGPSGLYTLVAHEPVLIPSAVTSPTGARATGTLPPPGASVEGAFVQGAPRSPNGAWIVVATRFGVLRRESGNGSLVRVKELEGLYPSLRECVIADGGNKLACVRETKVVVIDANSTPPPPSGDE